MDEEEEVIVKGSSDGDLCLVAKVDLTKHFPTGVEDELLLGGFPKLHANRLLYSLQPGLQLDGH